MAKLNHNPGPKKERAILKATGSVLLAIIASSHHWLHTLLIALGLTTLGAGLFTMPPLIKILFMLLSLVLSGWFLIVAKRKWPINRPAAWVYLLSSIISIIFVLSAIPDTLNSLKQPSYQEIPQLQHGDHENHSK
ncbi:hypothetical protein [Caldibacillus thermoamylovorans]|uniref:hypothetical protein n=1 Tax=Caldibacillus thermoamylovorans TaxID=35841 RepID=UPI0022E5C450|nr:hypothetical protein [Caldibacillus thermoamylovorans]